MQDKILKLYFKVLTVGLAPAIENAIMCEANCAGGRVIAWIHLAAILGLKRMKISLASESHLWAGKIITFMLDLVKHAVVKTFNCSSKEKKSLNKCTDRHL